MLNSNKWALRKITGDGLCFLNAITLGYNELVQSNDAIKPIALNEPVTRVKTEVEENLNEYEQFFDQTAHKLTLLKQLNEYLDNRVYDLDVSDLCINATCNALQVQLTIYEEMEKGIIRYSIPPSRAEKSVSPTLNLLRSGPVGYVSVSSFYQRS